MIDELRQFSKTILDTSNFEGMLSIKEYTVHNSVVNRYELTLKLYYTSEKIKPVIGPIKTLYVTSITVTPDNLNEGYIILYRNFFNFMILMSAQALLIQEEKLNLYRK